MAVDEALLAGAGESGVATLRLYAWSEPTLSLGYFQRYAERESHPTSLTCPVVRRMSGGGAILHDREATYSLILPTAHPAAQQPASLYAFAHESAIELLGAAAARLVAQDESTAPASEPFLCFQRRAVGDVVVGDQKILGSAQRRRDGAILQHGSLLWEASPRAPELPGLQGARPDLSPIDTEDWIDDWALRFASRLNLELSDGELSPLEASLARRLAAEKYEADAWTRRR